MIGPRTWFLIALAILILTAYADVTNHDFVYFDDGAYLFQNGWTARGFTLENLWHFLSTTTGGQYMPVTMISYLPLVSIFGMKAPPQLWFNVALHTANCLLLVWVLHKYTGWFWRSACVALLLALHPIHVESVAWATERKDVLFMFFGLLTLLAYASYARKPAWHTYALTIALYALSMLSKAMLISLPALLLLLDVWPLGRVPKLWTPPTPSTTLTSSSSTQDTGPRTQDSASLSPDPRLQTPAPLFLLLEKLPFLAIGIAMAVITVKSTPITGSEAIPFDLKIGVALMGYIDYLINFLWPVDLCGLYPIPAILDKPLVALRLAVMLVITAVAAWQFKKRPYLLIGWLWYVGTLTPVSGIMQAGTQARADRFVYWPFLGIYIAIVWLAWDLLTNRFNTATHTAESKTQSPAQSPNNIEGLPSPVAYAGLLGLGILASLLWTLSVRQVAFWQDSETFFTRIISVTGPNPQAHGALAVYYVDKNRLSDAQAQFLASLKIKPEDPGALIALSNIAFLTDHPTDGRALLERGLAIPRPYKEDASHAALMLLNLGEPKRALEVVTKCLQNAPANLAVRANAGVIFAANGKVDEGVAFLQSALKESPGDVGILMLLGSVYGNLGRIDLAGQTFLEAISAQPQDPRPYPKLAQVYIITGQPQKARQAYEAGLSINPKDPECLQGLANLNAQATPSSAR